MSAHYALSCVRFAVVIAVGIVAAIVGFARNKVGAARAAYPYRGMSVWVDVGTQDPFRISDTDLAEALRHQGQPVEFHLWPGSHSGSYWRAGG